MTEEGGADGHTAVMLRALGVPSVLGAAGLAHTIQPGDTVVIDGSTGIVVLNPGPETLGAARRYLEIGIDPRDARDAPRRLRDFAPHLLTDHDTT